MKKIKWILAVAMALAAAPALAEEILNGAGATFPAPLYRLWFDTFQKETGIRTDYQAVGSGEGIKKLLARSVDFGATDAFLSDDDLAKVTTPILHLPTCVGAVAITYNLPGHPTLNFSADVLADVFRGIITNWSDGRIRALNPQVKIDNLDIAVVHRADSSGTNFSLTEYLSKANTGWKVHVGTGKKVKWPVGMGLDGNGAVARMIADTPGAIGYVSLDYALENHLPVAALKNRSDRFVLPSTGSVSMAAAVDMPADTRVSITDTPVPEGYPVSTFTWLIFYSEQGYDNRPLNLSKALALFFNWAMDKGQHLNATKSFSPLPDSALTKARAVVSTITWKGQPVDSSLP